MAHANPSIILPNSFFIAPIVVRFPTSLADLSFASALVINSPRHVRLKLHG
jgi:hypothetical protein